MIHEFGNSSDNSDDLDGVNPIATWRDILDMTLEDSGFEIFNTKNGDNIIVFYKKNGKLLEPHEGKIALISTDDIKNGPRHIKWLQQIIIKKND